MLIATQLTAHCFERRALSVERKNMPTTTATMDNLIQANPHLVPFHEGETVEVEILAKSKKRTLVDLFGLTTGIIPEREYSSVIEEIKVGDKILAQVICQENDDGVAVLSLKRADRQRIWEQIQEEIKSGKSLSVRVKDVNRGGLIIEYQNLEGFMPLSQLSPEHYPRVGGNNPGKIVEKISSLIGKRIPAKIINPNPDPKNLIFSERAAVAGSISQELEKIKIGDDYNGVITRLTDFGFFVRLEVEGSEGALLEGLVHLSEISWSRTEAREKKFASGDKVKVKVIGINNNRLALSIKQLSDDPWREAVTDFIPDQEIEANLTKLTPFGGFIKLNEIVDGTVSLTEKEIKEKALKEGEKYRFKIKKIDNKLRRVILELT
ncbi:MAG: 30S ribosomal protein S1 [Candidatus Berkelbacteria bacterium Licking1014_2]|uniref:30S ribosomal protein S1 n=1 Tax=Candidatus Berkelbacteria bacterium Licking1014_2 TaxID=2017146 RepID=A0A554LVQ9_9BACT|nr:MAG: 30S ribosomal protein S1 [Candidatus Berkelbacteria bacterium Licking1014_2]